LPLQWRHIDFEARVIRLDPHTTKNDEGRTFPFTDVLQHLLEAQKVEHDRIRAEGVLCPWYFTGRARRSKASRSCDSRRRVEEGHARRLAALAGFRTTFDERRCGISCALASLNAWRCR